MRSSKFKITVKGDEADESIRLGDLVDQLNALKLTLNQVDASIAGGKPSDLYYRVTKITMNSPITVEVEAVSKSGSRARGQRVVSKLNRDIRSVIAGKRPREADLDLLESYRALVKPMQRHVVEVSFQFENELVPLPRNLDIKVDEILGPDQTEQGSIVGSLDVLDIHNHRNVFKVYPVVGPKSIKCSFTRAQLPEAIAGINHFVKISGLLHYKKAEKFPHLIKVDSIEVLPERGNVSSLSGLRGMVPDAFDGLSSTEYVEKVRNGEW
ncbi:hypothetical protein WT81_33350 [Burkholderia stagnalis]|uniref:hypothetical protein n=1 Tax=Burkholderia stagnalis TaxID=1503054 RepID=UPI00075F8F13|nr:hypothetical protein [Burkholderia stagnalis]KWK50430.1 hypothetical protein WT80_00825 [Burkholderia stagnalis]KWK65183.1 hypothetical protein WT81_33350 [Burkholderia stagnalis]KWN76508.1 hypothetical protein WT90_00590 [Burkholderia stagnalis]